MLKCSEFSASVLLLSTACGPFPSEASALWSRLGPLTLAFLRTAALHFAQTHHSQGVASRSSSPMSLAGSCTVTRQGKVWVSPWLLTESLGAW